MKTIGLLGGMSWESTAHYYQAINSGVKQALGGLHSAEIVLYSVDFAPIEKLQARGDWSATAELLVDAARRIQRAGADFLLICTNTMHKVAPAVQGAVQIPLLHIVDATAGAIKTAGAQRPLLLATRYTMEQPFYRDRLSVQHGIDVVVPGRLGGYCVLVLERRTLTGEAAAECQPHQQCGVKNPHAMCRHARQ